MPVFYRCEGQLLVLSYPYELRNPFFQGSASEKFLTKQLVTSRETLGSDSELQKQQPLRCADPPRMSSMEGWS